MSDQVVELRDMGPGVVLIKMQDRVHKNTFSEALLRELVPAFKTVSADTRYKAVILTGYDSYFSSGGTKDSLLRINAGQSNFTDTGNIYSLPLECPIPVISAMQGHGIGGGFAFGLFSDFVVMSRESIYTTNFMKYGFTPGMGATLMLPKKLGLSLAEEMLFTARTYYGRDLQERGVPYPVLPRAEVLDYAIHLANSIAEKPRISLVTLKDHLVADLREQLPQVVAQELAMHEKTFFQPEVRNLIEQQFGN